MPIPQYYHFKQYITVIVKEFYSQLTIFLIASISCFSLLSNPEVLRQLQTLQQSISQVTHADMDLEKLRKLQEMKLQEEEFDKHLAQTIPVSINNYVTE